jgi:hypothetical protein
MCIDAAAWCIDIRTNRAHILVNGGGISSPLVLHARQLQVYTARAPWPPAVAVLHWLRTAVGWANGLLVRAAHRIFHRRQQPGQRTAG